MCIICGTTPFSTLTLITLRQNRGGQTIMNVIRCPCCPKDAKPNPERAATKAALEELLGDDEDGLAATFEDYRL